MLNFAVLVPPFSCAQTVNVTELTPSCSEMLQNSEAFRQAARHRGFGKGPE